MANSGVIPDEGNRELTPKERLAEFDRLMAKGSIEAVVEAVKNGSGDIMKSSTSLLGTLDPPLPREAWPDPTPEMIESNGFGPIWDCIKSWDINVPGIYAGYCGATGNHVRNILDHLHQRGFKIVPIS